MYAGVFGYPICTVGVAATEFAEGGIMNMKRGILVLLMVLVLMFAILIGCGKSDRDDLVRADAADPTVNKTETDQDVIVAPDDAFPPVIITEPVESNCKLIVDGKEIPDCYVYIREDGRTAMVPILTVLESLGIEMTWENENDIHIEHGGKVYIFELDRGVLYEKDERLCLFMAPPGEDRYRMYYELVNGEYLVDHFSLELFAHYLDINFWVYSDEPAVYVVKRENASCSAAGVDLCKIYRLMPGTSDMDCTWQQRRGKARVGS